MNVKKILLIGLVTITLIAICFVAYVANLSTQFQNSYTHGYKTNSTSQQSVTQQPNSTIPTYSTVPTTDAQADAYEKEIIGIIEGSQFYQQGSRGEFYDLNEPVYNGQNQTINDHILENFQNFTNALGEHITVYLTQVNETEFLGQLRQMVSGSGVVLVIRVGNTFDLEPNNYGPIMVIYAYSCTL
jgi:hypothetical protein